MTYYTSTIIIIFCIIGYMIIVDKNVGDYIILLTKIIRINLERFYWIIVYHPNNFVTTWLNARKYDKISKDLQKEFERKSK